MFREIDVLQPSATAPGKWEVQKCAVNFHQVVAIVEGEIPSSVAGLNRLGTVLTLITGQQFVTRTPYPEIVGLLGIGTH